MLKRQDAFSRSSVYIAFGSVTAAMLLAIVPKVAIAQNITTHVTNVTPYESSNSFPTTVTSGGPSIVNLGGQLFFPNVVPYRHSPLPNSYFSFPGPKTPQSATHTLPRNATSKTMGLTYTGQGTLDYFQMYMDWGAAAVQQSQPQMALGWYEKAWRLRSNSSEAAKAVQSLRSQLTKVSSPQPAK